MEAAVSHGYLGATVKDYAQKRHNLAPVGKSVADLARDFGGMVKPYASADGPH